jgi:hypothetical protein
LDRDLLWFSTAILGHMKKRYWHSFADADGESHVEELDVGLESTAFAPPAPDVFLSGPVSAVAFAYLTLPAGWDGGWHPTPLRQLYVQLKGMVEGQVSDGTVVRLGPGDVVLLEDTTGRGHVTRVLGDANSEALVIALS